MSSKGQSTTKRLIHELRSYDQEPSRALLHLAPVSDDELLHWTAVMKGVEGTAYEDGCWKLDIQIPDTYPLAPPKVRFVTPICHPNVHFKTGEICLDLLKTSWSPAYTITSTMDAIQQLLTSAEPDSPLNVDIAQLFRQGDELGSQSLIRFYTELYKWRGD
ncbi:ubiquitin-conjugating enzyme [Myriangium duriaei CBS 260.36]|uniref:Ubiquitin-conjugating enzyme n=1 Tax=Myriangium duriaei CBS 260.36 TaxID=1168546 RepID=A0A9P4J3M7_9PEZI|nr:ubiquitin-conjugating enzyme [Myriangium duriaei CBS 260.36]